MQMLIRLVLGFMLTIVFVLDLEIGVNDPSDSLYAFLTSSEFDLLNNYVAPVPFNVISPNNSCTYVFNMYDSFGDGWNGASVDISVNGIISHSSIGSSFTTGSSSSYNLIVSDGDIISIPSGNWTSGSWDSEISWDIQDYNGTVIASGCHPSHFLVFIIHLQSQFHVLHQVLLMLILIGIIRLTVYFLIFPTLPLQDILEILEVYT